MENPVKTDFRGLLSNCGRLAVPIYQRPYSWEAAEISDFVLDLERTLSSIGPHQDFSHHFFGTVITIPRHDDKGTYHEVVDGQQRVTTCTITCLAVIDGLNALIDSSEDQSFKSATQALVNTLRGTYLEIEIWDPEADVMRTVQRLELSQLDNPWLKAVVAGSEPPENHESHRRLNRAYRRLFNDLVKKPILVSESSDGEKRDRLRLTMVALGEYSQVVHIPADSGEEAYQLFMTLNDRGRQLAAGDLLRTRSLELLRDFSDLQALAAEAWDRILDRSATSVDTFLRAYYASRRGVRLAKRRIYVSYRDELFPDELHSGLTEEATEFAHMLAAMAEEAEWYSKLEDGSWPWESSGLTAWQTDRLDRYVKRLGRRGELPILLSARSTGNEELFFDILSTLERTAFRNSILRGHWGQFAERVFEEAPKVRSSGENYESDQFDFLMSVHVWSKGDDEAFRNSLRSHLKYPSGRAELKHALTTLDDCWLLDESVMGSEMLEKANQEQVWAWELLHVEHIYPQQPKPSDREFELDPHGDDLGNLTIWRDKDNSAQGNKTFVEKRPHYSEAGARMTRALEHYEAWDFAALREREDDLLDRLMRLYAIRTDVTQPDIQRDSAFYLGRSITDRTRNPYPDRTGGAYAYLQTIPNGQQINHRDFLALFDSSTEGVFEVHGLARVGRVVADGIERHAVFDRYISVAPRLEFEIAFGDSDPRSNSRNSINRLDEAHLSTLLDALEISIDEIPPVEGWDELAEELADLTASE